MPWAGQVHSPCREIPERESPNLRLQDPSSHRGCLWLIYSTPHPCNLHSQQQQLQLHKWPIIKSFPALYSQVQHLSLTLHCHSFTRGQCPRRGQRGGSVADTHFWLSHFSGRVSSECTTCGHPSSRSEPAPWSHHGAWSSGCQLAWSSYIFPLRRAMRREQWVRPCSLWNCLYGKKIHPVAAKWTVQVKGQGFL